MESDIRRESSTTDGTTLPSPTTQYAIRLNVESAVVQSNVNCPTVVISFISHSAFVVELEAVAAGVACLYTFVLLPARADSNVPKLFVLPNHEQSSFVPSVAPNPR